MQSNLVEHDQRKNTTAAVLLSTSYSQPAARTTYWADLCCIHLTDDGCENRRPHAWFVFWPLIGWCWPDLLDVYNDVCWLMTFRLAGLYSNHRMSELFVNAVWCRPRPTPKAWESVLSPSCSGVRHKFHKDWSIGKRRNRYGKSTQILVCIRQVAA